MPTGSSPPLAGWAPADGRDPGHPYRWRTWWRCHLPWFLLDLGLAGKGRDCLAVGGWHRWYNRDGETSGCYHCRVVGEGRLWQGADERDG